MRWKKEFLTHLTLTCLKNRSKHIIFPMMFLYLKINRKLLDASTLSQIFQISVLITATVDFWLAYNIGDKVQVKLWEKCI